MKIRFLITWVSAVLACGLQPAFSNAAGVYSPAARWTKDRTVALDITENPLTLAVCWEQPDLYVYKDSESDPEREVVINTADVKIQIQAAVERAWKQFTNIHFNWINNKVGASCDIKIILDHRINQGQDNAHTIAWYSGLGVLSQRREIRINLMFFDAMEVRNFDNPATKYGRYDWKRPGVAKLLYEDVLRNASTEDARRRYAQRKANMVMVHEFGHALGIHHEFCYDLNSFGSREGCDAYYRHITGGTAAPNPNAAQQVGPYDPYSVMLYNGSKQHLLDAEASCGDVITIRALYGVKEAPGHRHNHCRIGTNVCRTITPMPKTSEDPLPTDIPGGTCHMPEVDEAALGFLPLDQISKQIITTQQNVVVNVEKTISSFTDNPMEPQRIPMGTSCMDKNWISPSQDAQAPVFKTFPGREVNVRIDFIGYKDYEYQIWATGATLGDLAKTPKTPIKSMTVSENGPTSFNFNYPVPSQICTEGPGQVCTADKNWFLGFMLLSARTFSGGSLPPITQLNSCHTTRAIWVSEEIKTKIIVQEIQPVTKTAEARLAILNLATPDAGPLKPDAITDESYPLSWVHSDQVISQTFDLLLYDAKDSDKNSPRAAYSLGTHKRAAGTNTIWVRFPASFTNPAGTDVKVKGWARLRGIGALATSAKLTAFSPPIYIGNPPPRLFSLEPAEGDPGDIVMIKGRFINAPSLQVKATYRGEQVEVTEKTEDYIRIVIPSTRQSGTVTVTVDGVPSNGLAFQIWPRIESIVPEHPRAGEAAEIRGYGLTHPHYPTGITLGDETVPIIEASEGSIKFSIARSSMYGPGPLRVSVGPISVSQIVTPVPVISTGTQDAGVPGQEIVIMGEGFPPYAQVNLNGSTVSGIQVMSLSAIRFTIPQGASSGALKVVIPAMQGQTAVTSNSVHFTVGPKPTFISSDYGLPGSSVEIGGSFGHSGSSRTVRIGQWICALYSSTPSSLRFGIPPGLNFPSGMLSVEVDGIRADFAPFTVLPLVTGLSRKFVEPGEEIRLIGYFGGNELVIRSSTAVVTHLGKGTAGDRDYLAFVLDGAFNSTSLTLAVKRYMGTGEITLGSETIWRRPTIESVDPPHGKVGDPIILSGSHFTHGGGRPEVRFNEAIASVSSHGDDKLIVIVPPGSGNAMIEVARTEGGIRAASFLMPFRYAPTITSFSPNIAIQGGVVNIVGGGFSPSGNNLVYVGNTLATILSQSATALKLRVHPKSVTGELRVVSDGASSAALPIKVNPFPLPALSILLE